MSNKMLEKLKKINRKSNVEKISFDLIWTDKNER